LKLDDIIGLQGDINIVHNGQIVARANDANPNGLRALSLRISVQPIPASTLGLPIE